MYLELPINTWKPARLYPLTYPGDCPDGSFLIINNEVVSLNASNPDDVFFMRDGENHSLNTWLKKQKLPLLKDRIMVLAYGANRNPATLKIKFENYNYKYIDQPLVVPVFKAKLKNADVVASGLHGQGYFYADLLLESRHTLGTEIDVWINLLDEDQFRVIEESENVSKGLYTLGQIDHITLSESNLQITALAFLSASVTLIYQQTNTPVAFENVFAQNRKIIAMSTSEMLRQFIRDFSLIDEIQRLANISYDTNFAQKFSNYLNVRWWEKFKNPKFEDPNYTTILKSFNHAIQSGKAENTTAENYNKMGKLVKPKSIPDNNNFKFDF